MRLIPPGQKIWLSCGASIAKFALRQIYTGEPEFFLPQKMNSRISEAYDQVHNTC
jgi:hypothetical protein